MPCPLTFTPKTQEHEHTERIRKKKKPYATQLTTDLGLIEMHEELTPAKHRQEDARPLISGEEACNQTEKYIYLYHLSGLLLCKIHSGTLNQSSLSIVNRYYIFKYHF